MTWSDLWLTLGDLDIEHVKILCETNFLVENFFGTLKICGGDLDPEPEKQFSENISG